MDFLVLKLMAVFSNLYFFACIFLGLFLLPQFDNLLFFEPPIMDFLIIKFRNVFSNFFFLCFSAAIFLPAIC